MEPKKRWFLCPDFFFCNRSAPGIRNSGTSTVFRGLQPSEARLRRAKRGSARLRRAKRGRPAERSEAVPPSEARPSHRAKRGSTERSKAPPRLRRAKRGRAKVIGRSPLQKNSKRFHQKAQGNHLIFFFFFENNIFIK